MERLKFIYRLEHSGTRAIFPKLYNDFLEIDELAKGEDVLAGIIAENILRATNDKLIVTASEDKISEYEAGLDLTASGGISERRQAVLDFISRAGTPDIHVSVSHDSLLLHVWQNADETDDDTPNPSGPLAFIVTQKLLPSIPQNIDTQAEIYAEPSVEACNTIGQYVTLSTDLGIAQ